MNASELLRLVDAIHRDKNIEKEIVFEGIEAALVSAAKKHYGEEEEIFVHIDREDGSISGTHNGNALDPEETVGRIGAQTAKQVMIQKIREAERDSLFDEYEELKGDLISGVVQRYEHGMATVTLSNAEAILPRSEQIPGETHHPNERVRAVVYEVRKAGSRVKIVLSRTRPELVQRLFEQEIPEIADGVIAVRAMAREAGYRSKVAVSSSDQRVDCVGACVGVRGNRIKNIVDELSGERIDIVRWSDDLQDLVPNALQPAEVEEVILCQMLGRAIVLVREDQLSLAIGRRGQNVRLASKLCGWDIEIMTREELDEQIESAVAGFCAIEGVEDSLAEKLVGEGFLSYGDLSIIEPDDLIAMGELTAEQVDVIVAEADVRDEAAEKAAGAERRRQREQDRLDRLAAAEEAAAKAAEPQDEDEPGEDDQNESTDESTTGEGATDESATDESTTDESTTDESTTDESTTDESGLVADDGEAEVSDLPPAEDATGDDSVGDVQEAVAEDVDEDLSGATNQDPVDDGLLEGDSDVSESEESESNEARGSSDAIEEPLS